MSWIAVVYDSSKGVMMVHPAAAVIAVAVFGGETAISVRGCDPASVEKLVEFDCLAQAIGWLHNEQRKETTPRKPSARSKTARRRR
jgi:hypothetical protein